MAAAVPSQAVPHQAKQDAAVRVLRCAGSARLPASATCTLTSMNRLAAEAVAGAARGSGVRARRKQRRMGTYEPSSAAQPDVTKSTTPAMAALLAGECTQAERRMCENALGRGKGAGGPAHADHATEGHQAELCVLRPVDQPLPVT